MSVILDEGYRKDLANIGANAGNVDVGNSGDSLPSDLDLADVVEEGPTPEILPAPLNPERPSLREIGKNAKNDAIKNVATKVSAFTGFISRGKKLIGDVVSRLFGRANTAIDYSAAVLTKEGRQVIGENVAQAGRDFVQATKQDVQAAGEWVKGQSNALDAWGDENITPIAEHLTDFSNSEVLRWGNAALDGLVAAGDGLERASDFVGEKLVQAPELGKKAVVDTAKLTGKVAAGAVLGGTAALGGAVMGLYKGGEWAVKGGVKHGGAALESGKEDIHHAVEKSKEVWAVLSEAAKRRGLDMIMRARSAWNEFSFKRQENKYAQLNIQVSTLEDEIAELESQLESGILAPMDYLKIFTKKENAEQKLNTAKAKIESLSSLYNVDLEPDNTDDEIMAPDWNPSTEVALPSDAQKAPSALETGDNNVQNVPTGGKKRSSLFGRIAKAGALGAALFVGAGNTGSKTDVGNTDARPSTVDIDRGSLDSSDNLDAVTISSSDPLMSVAPSLENSSQLGTSLPGGISVSDTLPSDTEPKLKEKTNKGGSRVASESATVTGTNTSEYKPTDNLDNTVYDEFNPKFDKGVTKYMTAETNGDGTVSNVAYVKSRGNLVLKFKYERGIPTDVTFGSETGGKFEIKAHVKIVDGNAMINGNHEPNFDELSDIGKGHFVELSGM